jgi:hypothetical protein
VTDMHTRWDSSLVLSVNYYIQLFVFLAVYMVVFVYVYGMLLDHWFVLSCFCVSFCKSACHLVRKYYAQQGVYSSVCLSVHSSICLLVSLLAHLSAFSLFVYVFVSCSTEAAEVIRETEQAKRFCN